MDPEFRQHILEQNSTWIEETSERLHPVQVAEELEKLEDEEIQCFLGLASSRPRALIFTELDTELQDRLISSMSARGLANIVTYMSHDERADLVNRLSGIKMRVLLPALSFAEREDIRRLASYPEGTAGAVMTSDYTVLEAGLSVREAIDSLRHQALDRETIYYSYVLDPNRRLIGLLTLKDLVLADPQEFINGVMAEDIITHHVDDDQEDVAQTIRKYDLLAIPILDHDERLVGIVTHDDAIDILEQEHTEDLEKFMAITGGHQVGGYLKTSPWQHFRNRVFWIVILAMMGLISGFILHSFEATLTHLIILAIYMPMMADAGGNAGSQTATVVIQALTRKELNTSDILKVIWKEVQIGGLLGLVLATLALVKVYLFSYATVLPPGYTLLSIAGVISGALAIQVVSSALIGAVLPLAAVRFRLDPAVIASPAITTIVDITGLLIYFLTARFFLGI